MKELGHATVFEQTGPTHSKYHNPLGPMSAAEARIRRLEGELESLRRSTKAALEESWKEVERLESENTYREEKILALQAQLASYLHKETEEDLTRDSTSATSSQSQSLSPVSQGENKSITVPINDELSGSDHRIEINFPSQNAIRSLLSNARQTSMRSLASIGSRQNSMRSVTSPMNSLRSGTRSCNVAMPSFHRCPAGESTQDIAEKFDASESSLENFPISALRSQLRSGLKKCNSFKVKTSHKEKPNEPTEMEKALLRQLEYLQEEKHLDIQDLELKIEQRDAVIDSLETKLAVQESTIKELLQTVEYLRRRTSRTTKHCS
jgi:uncharacterized coiled-coil protein SlyX